MGSHLILLSVLAAELAYSSFLPSLPNLLPILAPVKSCNQTVVFSHSFQKTKVLSPNFPFKYPFGLNCMYNFQSPTKTKLKIECVVYLPPHFLCKRGDKLSYSLSTGNQFRDACGVSVFKAISSSNQLLLRFRSDKQNFLEKIFFPFKYFKCKVKVIKNKFGGNSGSTCGRRRRQQATPINTPSQQNSEVIEIQQKILGGNVASPGQFPWRCALQRRSATALVRICSCTIISEMWILSAQHCTTNLQASEMLYALVGINSFQSGSSGLTPNHLRVSRFIQHSTYVANANDLSLLQLSTPLQFSDTVSPICLPCHLKGQQLTGFTLTVSGWVDSDMTANLLYTDLQVMNRANCSLLQPINSDEFCTFEPGKTACNETGDSGSFADYLDPNTGLYYAAGVYSWSNVCSSQDKPSVHQNVARFLDWIESSTGK